MGLRWIKAGPLQGAHIPLKTLGTGRMRRQRASGMSKMKLKTLILSAVAAAAFAAPALAQSPAAWEMPKKGDWIITGRVTDVFSEADNAITTAAGADSGLTKHEIRAQGGATDVAVHETWVLPPVVTLQYRPLTEGRFSPYVGAGVNYMLFYSGEDKNGFKVDLDDNFGYALQAGADIGIQGPWNLNVDVKKVWVNIDADINDGALKSDVDLDPWVVSVGVGRKF